MPASVSTVLVDTSVAVAPVVADHDHHEDTFQALRGRTLGLAGHAAFERRTLATVAKLLAHTFPATRFLGAGAAMSLLRTRTGRNRRRSRLGCADRYGCQRASAPLATRDRQALKVYRALAMEAELLA